MVTYLKARVLKETAVTSTAFNMQVYNHTTKGIQQMIEAIFARKNNKKAPPAPAGSESTSAPASEKK